jgi:polysaccharide deactylase WbmS-like protein
VIREQRLDPVAITLDVDWAPDHAIDAVAGQLIERDVRATWFVTHASPAIERLRERPELFELGIHPNFAPGSTHGETPEAVLDHCMALVPEARAMRTHGLVQSTALLALGREHTPIRVDASLFLPGAAGLAPIEYPLAPGPIVRVPYLWEDDAEMLRPDPAWDAWGVATGAQGLAVFDFHPIHVILNSADTRAYEALKQRGLDRAGPADLQAGDGLGAGTAFAGLVDGLAGGGRRISELA